MPFFLSSLEGWGKWGGMREMGMDRDVWGGMRRYLGIQIFGYSGIQIIRYVDT
jgi:hypothetical protein